MEKYLVCLYCTQIYVVVCASRTTVAFISKMAHIATVSQWQTSKNIQIELRSLVLQSALQSNASSQTLATLATTFSVHGRPLCELLGLQPLKLWTDPAHSKPDVGVKCLYNVHISAPLMRCLMCCIIHLMLLKSYFTPRRSLDYNSFKQLMKLQALCRNTPIAWLNKTFSRQNRKCAEKIVLPLINYWLIITDYCKTTCVNCL